MKLPDTPVGPRGLALLAVTAVAGLVLAVHGWSGHRSGLAPGLAAAGSSSPAAGGRVSPSASPARKAGPAATSAGPSASSAAPVASTGPLLSGQSFAQYSYQVWPGAPDAAARAALTGLSVSVHRQGSGISVAAGVSGQPGTSRFYPQGTRVYVIEASLGDDSGNSDYNMGDDGLVVTNAQGRILQ
ncbi:MAG TPA: hypothetical protein VMV07_09080 [Streptosporangiaceae bacterium]|nr:hypothetical protein [Streptosporangiaceae bacterium]